MPKYDENEQLENTDEQSQEEELDLEEESDDESDYDVETLKEQLQSERERREKAEHLIEKHKNKAKQTSNTTGLTREEAILFAKGLSEDEVSYASEVAKIKKISLQEASEHSHFIIWKKEKEKESKTKETSLANSSRGSRVRKEKTLATPGLSKEERHALKRKQLGM